MEGEPIASVRIVTFSEEATSAAISAVHAAAVGRVVPPQQFRAALAILRWQSVSVPNTPTSTPTDGPKDSPADEGDET